MEKDDISKMLTTSCVSALAAGWWNVFYNPNSGDRPDPKVKPCMGDVLVIFLTLFLHPY